MTKRLLKKRFQKLAGINAKLLKEQDNPEDVVTGGDGYNGNNPFLYGGGYLPGGIPWHPTQYEGDNYPVPAGYTNDPFSNNVNNPNNCTYGNNCCGALHFCEFCDPTYVSTVLDFMIQNNISEINKVYMVNNAYASQFTPYYTQEDSNQCIDPNTGWNYIRFSSFSLNGWMWNGVELFGNSLDWAIGTDEEENLLNNILQTSNTGTTWHTSLFGAYQGIDSGQNGGNSDELNDSDYMGLYAILEWLGIDTSSISSFQDLINIFNSGGSQSGSYAGENVLGQTECYAGSHGTTCKPDNCFCATPCVNEDGTPCDYEGCTDPEAINYSEFATINDGSCQYGSSGYVCCNVLVNYPEAHEAAGSPCNSINQNPLGGNFWQNYSSTSECVYSDNWLLPQTVTTQLSGASAMTMQESGYNYNVDVENNTWTAQNVFETEQECNNTCAPWEWYCINQFAQSDFITNYMNQQMDDNYIQYMIQNNGWTEENILSNIVNPSFFSNGDGFDPNANGCVQAPNMETIPTVDPLSYFGQSTAVYQDSYTNYGYWDYGLTALSLSGQPAYKDEQGCNNACQTPGCTDPEAANYNELAVVDDGSCQYIGCTQEDAFNYNENATLDDGSCILTACIDPDASNYNAEVAQEIIDLGMKVEANYLENCEYPGCMDENALNYDPDANIDDGSCEIEGCTNDGADNYNPSANVDDGSCNFTYGCPDIAELGWAGGMITDPPEDYSIMEDGTTFCDACGGNCSSDSCAAWYEEMYDTPVGENWYGMGIVNPCGFWEESNIMDNFTPWILGIGEFEDGEFIQSPVPPEYLTGEYLANCCPGGSNWETQGCTDELALNYDSDADVDDGSCEYISYICTPKDSLVGGECIEVPAPPNSTFEWEFGVSLPTYATIEECKSSCSEKKEKIKCWKCKDGFPVMQTFLDGSVIDENQDPGIYQPDKGKGGCPKGWELAPDPWPYNSTGKNPCKKDPDRERPDPDIELEDPFDTTRPDDYVDDTVGSFGGPWFCPSDSGNFPWPSCCVQAGVDYSGVLTQYPEAPSWLQTYFESPVGTTYSSNVECNANSGCGQNMLPNGMSNCAGTYSPGPPDDDPGFGINESLVKRFKKLAGIKNKK